MVFQREDGSGEELTYGQLRERVAAVRAGLVELGVTRGDRVVALVPKEDLEPGSEFHLDALRTIGSTGAPLTPEGFRWIADAISPHIQIASVSGGTLAL